ncbi:RAD55 family ATPase [Candidatus Woesearchaeota archaeon]|nr:RAD55 family ATPase [Candidatus Woesearchaeota archaeon]
MKQKIERVPTYIKGLDEEIQGGIPKGFVNLVYGTSGTMKSSVVFNIIYNEALKGKNSFYISIEQSYDNLSLHLSNLGLDLSKINVAMAGINSPKLNFINKAGKKAGTIIFLDIPSIRERVMKTRKLGEALTSMIITSTIDKIKKSIGYDYFVLDALNALYAISEIKKPREMLFDLFEFLKTRNLTSFIIQEVTGDNESSGGVEDYLADGVLSVDTARYHRVVQREIIVKKMRATKSNINVFTFEFKDGKFRASLGGETPIIEIGKE